MDDEREPATGIHGARLQVLERGGHLAYLACLKAVTDAALPFLAG